MADPVDGNEHDALRRQQAKSARPRMNLQQIHSWVDLEIEQAERRGDFANLPGAGKPLKNVEKSDPDWWVKQMIEREKLDLSAAMPTVMALRQERRSYPESLVGVSDEVAVRERLEDYNARVLEDRRRPVVGPNSPAVAPRVDVEEMVDRWRELRAEAVRDAAGADPGDEVMVGDGAPARDGGGETGRAGSGASARDGGATTRAGGAGSVLLWVVALVVFAALLLWWVT